MKSKKNYISLFIASLIILKVGLYYSLMDITINFGIKLLLSLVYIGLIFVLLKRKKRLFLCIYILISLLMFADSVYFRYFNESLTFNIFGQAGQLGDVTETIKLLLSPKDFLLFLDIPIIYLYLKKYNKSVDKSFKLIYIISTIVIVTLVLINPINSDVVKGLNSQEFFTYHIKDIYLSIMGDDIKVGKSIEKELAKTLNKKPLPIKNKKLYGIGKNRNLIIIQVESFQNMVINKYYNGQELTPNLNKLIKQDTIYFNNYYQQLGKGNTSDAEFVSQNSIYAPIYGQAYDIYKDNYFYGLPWIMRDEGYKSIVFHGYKKEFWNRDAAYPNQGFQRFFSEKDFDIKEKIGFGLNDKDFFKQSIDYLKKEDKPFYSFLITLTCHNPYNMPKKYHNITLKAEDKDTLFGNYLQAVHYTDKAIGEFIKRLKDNNLYNNSVIAIYGDHFGLSSTDDNINDNVSSFLGYDYDFDEMMKIPLIINIPEKDINQTIDIVGGQIDFMPTILNLMGIESKNPIIFGRDLVNSNSGFVASQTYMLKGSFIKDDIVLEMSRDGIFKNSRAWNKRTRKSVDLQKYKKYYEKAIKEIDKAMYVLENNMLKEVIKKNKDFDYVNVTKNKIKPAKFISHAGGRIKGLTYTNSKESLDKSYEKGYKFIEVDFEWTSDEKAVLLHSWDGFLKKFFNVEPKVYSLKEFKNFKMVNNWHQMTLEHLSIWLKNHPNTCIVSDVKKDNIKLLSLISKNYPDIKRQIIPQIYHMGEYSKVKYLGYKNIIYTLYRSTNSEDEIINFAKHNNLLAITMPIDKAKTGLPKKLNKLGIFTYSHTINDLELAKTLEEKGIDGFYTDDLTE